MEQTGVCGAAAEVELSSKARKKKSRNQQLCTQLVLHPHFLSGTPTDGIPAHSSDTIWSSDGKSSNPVAETESDFAMLAPSIQSPMAGPGADGSEGRTLPLSWCI